MKAYVLNDTSSYHAGSAAAMDGLRHALRHHEILGFHRSMSREVPEDFAGADVVICNGEGTFHHGTPEPAWLMAQLTRARAQGRRAWLVNTVWQDNPIEWLQIPDVIITRDPWSRRATGTAYVFPDLCLSSSWHRPRTAGPFEGEIVVGGPGAGPDSASIWPSLERCFPHRARLQEMPWQGVIDTLAGCALYVTGEHHGVYAAACAGVPFVVAPSNSWKIEALLEWSGAHLFTMHPAKIVHLAGSFAHSTMWRRACQQFSRWLLSVPRMQEL